MATCRANGKGPDQGSGQRFTRASPCTGDVRYGQRAAVEAADLGRLAIAYCKIARLASNSFVALINDIVSLRLNPGERSHSAAGTAPRSTPSPRFRPGRRFRWGRG